MASLSLEIKSIDSTYNELSYFVSMDLMSGEIIFMSTLSQKIQVNILVLNLGDALLPVQFCVSMLCA